MYEYLCSFNQTRQNLGENKLFVYLAVVAVMVGCILLLQESATCEPTEHPHGGTFNKAIINPRSYHIFNHLPGCKNEISKLTALFQSNLALCLPPNSYEPMTYGGNVPGLFQPSVTGREDGMKIKNPFDSFQGGATKLVLRLLLLSSVPCHDGDGRQCVRIFLSLNWN